MVLVLDDDDVLWYFRSCVMVSVCVNGCYIGNLDYGQGFGFEYKRDVHAVLLVLVVVASACALFYGFHCWRCCIAVYC